MADDLHASIKNIPWRRLLLPSEHGSWAFVLEPLALGLIVAGTPAGWWLGLAIVLGFLSRKPAKLALSNSAAPSTQALQKPARALLVVFSLVAAAALAATVATSRWPVLLPLAVGFPPLFLFFLREQDGQTRSLPAELIATGICSMPLVSIALAANLPVSSALALGAVNLARAWPSLLYVRACLRGPRGETGQRTPAIVAQIVAPVILALLVQKHLLPWIVPVCVLVLSLRAQFFLFGGLPRLTARQLGVMEVAWGAFYTVATALACRS